MIANNNNWDSYEKYGIRIQEQGFELGTVDHNSKVWVDGEETEDELDGICAINLNSPEVSWYTQWSWIFWFPHSPTRK